MFTLEMEFIAKVTIAAFRNDLKLFFPNEEMALPTSDLSITITVTLPIIPTKELIAQYENAILTSYQENSNIYAYSVHFNGYKSIEQIEV